MQCTPIATIPRDPSPHNRAPAKTQKQRGGYITSLFYTFQVHAMAAELAGKSLTKWAEERLGEGADRQFADV